MLPGLIILTRAAASSTASGNAVETLDDAGDRRQFVVARVEVGTGAVRALHEQLDACLAIERWHAPRGLARDAQRLAARGEDVERRAAPQQLVDEWPHATEHVLAVVEHDEAVEPPETVGQVSMTGRPNSSRRPSTWPNSAATRSGSPIGASSTHHTPSGAPSSSAHATSYASRVLPHPPDPVIVSRRCSRISDPSEATSAARPTKLDNGNDRLVRPAI
jgi:hypothetical protein